MRIATVNVNGIRAAARKGMATWVQAAAPDILLLQEVRADEDAAAGLLPGYESVVWPCRVKGRAGVAVAVRAGIAVTVAEVRRGVAAVGTEEPDVDSGRWLEVDLTLNGASAPADGEAASGSDAPVPAVPTSAGSATAGADTSAFASPATSDSDSSGPDTQPIRTLTVVSAYLHSGQVGTEKMDQKYAHLDLVDARLAQLLARAQDGGPQTIMAGDLNVVRSEKDIKNWRPNHNKVAGVLDDEIAHLESWFDSGWVDVARELAGDVQGPYTWWSQRGKAFDNDAGWRLDYQVTTPGLAQHATAFTVDRAVGYASRWSDHAPLVVDYHLA